MAKRYMEEFEERGWSSVAGQVCPDCLADTTLAAAVAAAADGDECDYCGASSSSPDGRPLSAPVDAVLGPLVEGLRAEYKDPNEQVPYGTADGKRSAALPCTARADWPRVVPPVQQVSQDGAAQAAALVLW